MSAINVGDVVQLVFGRCATQIRGIGWTGTVVAVVKSKKKCLGCGYRRSGWFCEFGDKDVGLLPRSWLKKTEPPDNQDTVITEEELMA